MSMADDARFWNRSARKYAKGRISDEAGYARTLERTRALLKPDDNVLELGCGTGTTAIRLAGSVKDYYATDISTDMIAIAKERKQAAGSLHNLTFNATTAEALVPGDMQFNAVLGFNYLHLVRDLPGTLRHIHALLAPHGLFITKTPCVGDMNPLIRLVLPAMRAIGKAPYAGAFNAAELGRHISAGGFEILATEIHATKGNDNRPYIVARKR
ncbi:bifunctional 2-polyprenyl-6-hydroxyphenol methylase/3-demethylubiquinol 3-O-methyltransferase UbiG [Agrobacterium sp. OT33]|uniref:class I SAM-dependent methyltransferase n=1 Tax=Agrobacterium sp. OT33 TaxID=2815338 RepID=UPI001A8C2F33|nr:class I SAM-dependent methyltransferase [Agrobacterium sp. OT33]MBO0126099.1 class I SAM-dependent methyltransferase [Agrobacterium sp. OT33]